MDKKVDVEETRPGQPSPENWSEAAEDLVASGDTDAAISLLETVVSRLEGSPQSETTSLQLSSALEELAKLYSSKNFSLKADALLSRASLLKLQASGDQSRLSGRDKEKVKSELAGGKALNAKAAWSSRCAEKSIQLLVEASESNGSDDDDDWEAMADRSPDELLTPDSSPSVSNVLLEEENAPKNKRRGRGTFSYNKDELYSDRIADLSLDDQREDKAEAGIRKPNTDARESRYGTRHVLVLADFPPSTRTIDLEKLFDDFRNRGIAMRWVNDTTALAVFRTPAAALEAHDHIAFPFKAHILDEDDPLVASISSIDLEPPRQRPQTSARTAQRLIAQGMGLKLSNSTFGSRELKTQEEARKNRIVTRQKLIEDAWGDD